MPIWRVGWFPHPCLNLPSVEIHSLTMKLCPVGTFVTVLGWCRFRFGPGTVGSGLLTLWIELAFCRVYIVPWKWLCLCGWLKIYSLPFVHGDERFQMSSETQIAIGVDLSGN